jgi:parallel beta-helix repeat protein
MFVPANIGDQLMRAKLLSALVVFALLMTVMSLAMSPTVRASLTTHSKINISGNSDANLSAFPGAGTAEDPIVITNLSIDGAAGTGIIINFVSLHLEIFNCTIFNASTGILISESSNITIYNNTCSGSSSGIYATDSTAITISNNTITGVGGSRGIFLDTSSTARLDGNNLTGCGISLWYSQPITFEDGFLYFPHTAMNNTYTTDMDITSTNTVNGAPVFFAKNVNMNNAFVPTNAGQVILLNVTYANIDGLNMHGGAILFWCAHISVENNGISGVCDDITMLSCYYVTVSHNQIVDAWHAGIRLYTSWYNNIRNNTVTHDLISSTAYGIVALYSRMNNITGNIVSDTYDGIGISYSAGNWVNQNTVTNSANCGVYIEQSIYTLVGQNIVNGSVWRGIFDERSSNNTIWGSSIKDAGDCGISLLTSHFDIIWSNRIVNSTSYGFNLTNCNHCYVNDNVLIGNNGAKSVYNESHIQAYDNGTNQWINNGNFWSDLQTPDANHDGVVDVPYIIAGGANVDSKPMTLRLTIVSPTSPDHTYAMNVTITGTADDLSGIGTITWYNQALNVSGACSGKSSWTATVPLVAGENNITLNMTDLLGISTTRNITVISSPDQIKPLIVIESPINNSYNNNGSVTVQWTASDALSGIAKTEISTNGTTWTTVTGNGDVLTLADGTYTIYVKVTDNADNVNQTAVNVTVDTVKPVVAINTPVNNALINGSVTVQWTASDALSGIAKTEISTDGTTWTTVTGTSDVLTLADGSYTVHVKVTDKARNAEQSSVSIGVDAAAPTVTAKSPVGTGVARGATVSVLFSEAMNKTATTITVNAVAGTLVWNGNNATFTPAADLAFNAVYDVTVMGKDIAGNSVTAAWTFNTLKDEGIITSTLKDADGNPIVGAAVTLSNGMTTTTDANGHFEFKNVTSGSYTLTVTKDGYQIVTQSVIIQAGQTNEAAALSMAAAAATETTSDNSLLIGAGAIGIVALLAGLFFVLKRRKK